MEGQNDQNDLKVKKIAVAVIVVFHLVGLLGFLIPAAQPYFIKLVPFHLLLMFAIIVFAYNADVKRLLLFVCGVFLCGFLVEVLGVSTGKIFGSYYYGNTLGYKIAAVPLLMGVNWVILIFSVGQMLKSMKIRNSILASLIGAVILVGFDFFLEPVAMKFDYWHWDWHQIPVQNYVAWFIVSVILLKFYYALDLKQQKYIGIAMFASQLIFFVVLYMTTGTNIFA
ncbi:carotenoid biosynthesis protein [Pedobacter roseus]|jgi:putative membrane protein|uniref:Carotenoid biosynthesis protein n=1 Tax=Pedobacter roseus TaxID=336820 RepID=A0A7G9QGR9_9SPHI|nr:carotenoid biosynthesis protein [Pedobacter roseus]QNN42544.1 carotenoid biosynthesis protein [Pedobacter roseus]